MDKKAKIFLSVYVPLLLAVSYLTMDIISPLTLPSPSMLGLNLLPLVGTYILLPGILVGAMVIWLMGSKAFAGKFLLIGILIDISLSAFVCNVFRAPVLTAVASRYGSELAEIKAEAAGRYIHPSFKMEEHIPRIGMFVRKRDEDILRRGFMEAYNSVFVKHYPEMINSSELRQEGSEKGYIAGLIDGRRANIREEPFREEPIGEDLLNRIETDFLSDFTEGYVSGYNRGWFAGFHEDLRGN